MRKWLILLLIVAVLLALLWVEQVRANQFCELVRDPRTRFIQTGWDTVDIVVDYTTVIRGASVYKVIECR